MIGTMLNGVTPAGAIDIFTRMKKGQIFAKYNLSENLLLAVIVESLIVLVTFSMLLGLYLDAIGLEAHPAWYILV